MLDAVQPETISTPEPNLVLNSSALEVSSHTEPEPSAPALVRKAPKHQDPDAVVYPFVDVQLRKARAHGRKRKSVKQDPIRCGLTSITVLGITWQSLVQALSCIVLHSTVDSLDVSSITWRPFKPANAPSLPLTNESGFNLFGLQSLRHFLASFWYACHPHAQ